MKSFKLKGAIQRYAWGGREFIQDLIGAERTNEPIAEYWMGAHDKAPAEIVPTGVKLNDLVKENPEHVLGKRVYQRFSDLPFLFKVLDVSDMLSIQVHPSKQEAEKGFERENNLGIALGAAHRNYKDDNHKPEIMVALGDFWLLHGFRSPASLNETLSSVPELSPLVSLFEEQGYRGLYQTVMEEPQFQTKERLQPLIDRLMPAYLDGNLRRESPEYWAAKAYRTFCKEGEMDKGIYSIFFFNIVNLKKGQGIFQDAGVPHAYMEGQNMELMANSDNVLRGGLTPKHVDVPELLQHVVFEETVPTVLTGEQENHGLERFYKSPAPDFELSQITLGNEDRYATTSETMEIIAVLEGEALLDCGSETHTLKRGEVAGVIANSNYKIESNSSAVLYKAKAGM